MSKFITKWWFQTLCLLMLFLETKSLSKSVKHVMKAKKFMNRVDITAGAWLSETTDTWMGKRFLCSDDILIPVRL